MIKSVTVTNHLDDSIKLELTRPEQSGFVIKNIEGLGPVKANINTTKLAAGDGVMYNSAYIDQRDIVISLLFLQTGDESIEDIRHKSYKYFPIKKKVQLTIETDRRTVKTEGYVEANEPNIFSANEGCSITIACPDPYFYSLETNEITFSGVESMFEFPFENDSLTESLINLGDIKKRSDEMLYYEGDLDVGVTITMHALGTVSDITLSYLNTGEQMKIDSHKIAFTTDIYPPYVDYNYNYGMYTESESVVKHNNHLWLCINTFYERAVEPGTIEANTNMYCWVILDGEYPQYDDTKNYTIGDKITYNGKLYVKKFEYGGNGNASPDHSSYGDTWVDLTGKYPLYGIIAGDTITVNTQKGKKGVTLLRNGVTYNLINTLDKNTDWFTITKGPNVFAYEVSSDSSYMDFKISSVIGYDGV